MNKLTKEVIDKIQRENKGKGEYLGGSHGRQLESARIDACTVWLGRAVHEAERGFGFL